MALVTGNELDPKKFFKTGQPVPQGSSFDLSIGHIFDHTGQRVNGPFTIKPGHIVQVVSSEEFDLSDRLTGHVTYKTTLTKRGIWALTVGIVDPGWNGPIATTLLNFSKVDHAITEGDAFLRVSFVEHAPVAQERLRKAPPLDVYLKDIQKAAATMFPTTFLDRDATADAAGREVLKRIRTESLAWVALIAVIFTIAQIVAGHFTRTTTPDLAKEELQVLRIKVDAMEKRLLKFEPSSEVRGQTAPQPPNSESSPPPSPNKQNN